MLSPLPAGAALAACLALLAGAVLAGPGREPPSPEVRYGEVDASRAPGGDARLETAEGSVRLRVAGLPAAGPERQYQVWLRTGRRVPRPARALFSVDAQGAGSVVLPPTPARPTPCW